MSMRTPDEISGQPRPKPSQEAAVVRPEPEANPRKSPRRRIADPGFLVAVWSSREGDRYHRPSPAPAARDETGPRQGARCRFVIRYSRLIGFYETAQMPDPNPDKLEKKNCVLPVPNPDIFRLPGANPDKKWLHNQREEMFENHACGSENVDLAGIPTKLPEIGPRTRGVPTKAFVLNAFPPAVPITRALPRIQIGIKLSTSMTFTLSPPSNRSTSAVQARTTPTHK
ncbi:hypothetical protein DFH09DRAFT_1092598 [Mycena vulgaris]|nr:hypothetical protein DFH09DRAFT_1092598 [Mycena vulgaris]